MRWSEYSADLPPRQHFEIVNLLTLGAGSVGLALQLAANNAPAVSVLQRLSVATAALEAARTRVDDPLAPVSVASLEPHPWGEMPERTACWQDLLAELEREEVDRVYEVLIAIVRDARQAAMAVITNQTVAAVHAALSRALVGLEQLRVLVFVFALVGA
jgi:hypothetical protein